MAQPPLWGASIGGRRVARSAAALIWPLVRGVIAGGDEALAGETPPKP